MGKEAFLWYERGVEKELRITRLYEYYMMAITEQKKEQERVEKMLYYDEMTGLKNRNCFERDLEEQLKMPASKGSILYMNIRKFKLYNELFGHSFGNKVLKEFAYMLNLYFADSYGIYRYSGDEFLINLRESDRTILFDKELCDNSTANTFCIGLLGVFYL